jgi:hypothetical protein
MPVKETQAKLWHNTAQEQVRSVLTQSDYDDMMMANIELKSTDFDSEHYALLFNRKTQESFPTVSDLHKADAGRVTEC